MASVRASPNDSNPCDDGTDCTLDDFCQGGFCTGNPNPCADGDPCTIDQCDDSRVASTPSRSVSSATTATRAPSSTSASTIPVEGCYGQNPTNCDDADACTSDPCDGAGGSRPTTRSSTAAPAPPTPATRAPAASTRTSSATTASDCTTDTCDDATGCVYTDAICDDGDPCTADSYVEGSGCVYEPIPGCGCTSTDNPKNLAYWKRLCNRGPPVETPSRTRTPRAWPLRATSSLPSMR